MPPENIINIYGFSMFSRGYIHSTWKNEKRKSSNPRVTGSNLRVTSSEPRVRRLRARVGRLKARVKSIKPRVKLKILSSKY